MLDKFKQMLNPDQQEKLEKQVAGEVEQKFSDAKSFKQPTYEKWKRFIDLYQGKHWKKNIPGWKSKTVENLCFSLVEAMLPLMTDRQPEIIILPTEESDVELSNELNQVLQFIWTKDGIQEKLTKVLRDKLILGTGVLKVRWDPDKDRGLGDITVDVIDPFDFFPDPNATTPEEMEWCIFRTRMSLAKIKRLYGKTVPSDNQYFNSDDSRGINNENRKVSGSDLATVLEYWSFDENGKAKVTMVSNGIVLEDKPTPYELDNKFPFILDFDHQLNGLFWGIGEFEQLEPLQLEVNKIRAIIMDNMIANNNAVWIVDKNAGIKTGGIKNEPGTIIEKNPGGDVRRESPPPLPNYIQHQLELTRKAMEEVSGVQDVSKGVISGSVSAASAIQILTENSQTRVRAKLRNTEYAISKLGEWVISMIAQFYTEVRTVRITGKDSKFQFQTFDASKMRQPDPSIVDQATGQVMPEHLGEDGRPSIELVSQFDIKVSAGSSMLLNKSAKYQQALELFKTGAMDIETLLNTAEIGDTKDIVAKLISYGSLKDPNAPQIDIKQVLTDLGVKVNMSVQNPDLIMGSLQQIQEQVQQVQEASQQNVEGMQQALPEQQQNPQF